MLGVVLLLSTAAPVRADTGLTGAVASAFFARTADAGLHEIAHQRVAELSACDCLEHDRMRAGTAEVLGWNDGAPNPVASVVGQWIGSPGHSAILANQTYGRIGCAELVDGGTHWFACVLAPGPLPARPAPAARAVQGAAPVVALPDTAMPAVDSSDGGSTVRERQRPL